MNTITTLLDHVRQIPGSAQKAAYLKANRSELLDTIVMDAMDPSITYGVTSKDVQVAGSGDCTLYAGFNHLLGRLAARDITGNAALEAVGQELSKYRPELQGLLKQVLDRDLKLGVSWKTYRAEVMGITEKFEVALAQHLEKVTGVDPVDGTWFASRKMDGMRCVAIVDCSNGVVEFRSRQDKEILTLDNLKPAALRFCSGLTGTWVLDGELCKVDANGDEDFQAIMKEARRKDYSLEDCCYQLFDILTYAEFCAGASKDKLEARPSLLTCLNGVYESQPHERCWVRPTKQERLHSQADFDRWAGYVEAGDWEGFMLRKDVPYKSGRTKDLLKVKKFFDMESVVEGVEVGEMTTSLPGEGLVKYQGVTNFWITYKGNRVDVGAGLSRDQRIAWMNDPSLIVGKTVTIKYFEESVNKEGKHSLRFPTLKYVYENGRDV